VVDPEVVGGNNGIGGIDPRPHWRLQQGSGDPAGSRGRAPCGRFRSKDPEDRTSLHT